MRVIADSGSTKTDWVLLNSKDNVEKRVQTQGINPYFQTSELIIEELFPVLYKNFNLRKIKNVYFYGAGCSSEQNTRIVNNALEQVFTKSAISVNDDMLAAARALLGDKAGIACILGTGSNSCLYDGVNITEKLFSPGYLFADEGSGAHLGKTFLTQHLRKKTPIELQNAFSKKHNLTDEEILINVYQKPNPNKFLASFTYFLKDNIGHQYIQKLVEYCFDEFIKEQVSSYTNFSSYPLSCTGSIGFHFKSILLGSLKKHKITPGDIVDSPMDGLINYHQGS